MYANTGNRIASRSAEQRKGSNMEPRLARRNSVGFIYFGIHVTGLIKFGFAVDPYRRIRQIQPYGFMFPEQERSELLKMPTILLGVMPGTIQLEKSFHLQHRGKFILEWYPLESEAANTIANMPFQPIEGRQCTWKKYRVIEDQCREMWREYRIQKGAGQQI
jgi:hypothetical protein